MNPFPPLIFEGQRTLEGCFSLNNGWVMGKEDS